MTPGKVSGWSEFKKCPFNENPWEKKFAKIFLFGRLSRENPADYRSTIKS